MISIRSFLAMAATVSLACTIASPAGATGDSFAPVFVKLTAVGGSGQSGRAVIRQLGPQIVVSGTVANESPYVLEPAHLRKGPCGSNAPVLHDLGMVTRGSLGTTLIPGYTIVQLHAMHASITVSKSEKALGVILSCGNF